MGNKDQVREAFAMAGVSVRDVVPIISAGPEPIFGAHLQGDAIKAWQQLRDVTPQTRLYPVVLADEELIQEAAADNPEPAESISDAAKIDAKRWLKRQADDHLEDIGGEPEEDESDDELERTTEFAVPRDMETGELRKDLKIALVPAAEPWHAAAYLRYCSPNYDIDPCHHVAVHKYWYERYGAELVTATGDILEMKVARPPRSDEEALALAKEQYGYCLDIVDQGVGSVKNLAAVLRGAPVWFFWWD